MSKLNIESTSEGSIAKFNGGQTIINEKENRCVIPPEASKEATCSDREEDYITMKLVGWEQEQGNKSEQPNR